MIYLSANNHPHVKVKIKFTVKKEEVECLVDTGFSSGIALPEKYLDLIKQPTKWKQNFELADGSVVELSLYKLQVEYGGKKKFVSAIFTKSDDALAGIEFLDGFKFVLDLKNYKVSLT